MTDYEKSIPRLTYSNPEDGESPNLVRFDNLNEPIHFRDLPIQDKCGVSPRYRVLELPRTDSGEVFIHVYNATAVGLRLRFYGLSHGAEVESIGDCREFTTALARFPLRLPDGFDAYLLRIGVGLEEGDLKTDLDRDHYFSVAAYAGKEPASPGGIKVEGRDKEQREVRYIPFSHNGRSFQRVVISTCDPKDDIRKLVAALGLETAETYYGPKGSVVALGVPPGMSLNTTIDTTTDIRQKGNSGEGTVSEDYILNLFSPKEPINKNEDDRWSEQDTHSRINAPSFTPPHPQQFDCEKQPLTVAIIDSGIDYSEANAHHWKATRYERGPDTEYITPGKYGYDFIRQREEPVDEAPHGTYVAASVLNQYRAEQPLQLLHMKVFGAEGIASYFGSLVSIYEAVAAGVKVINMSWGFYQNEPPKALYCAIKTAAKHGLLMVASAGNDTRDLDQIPQWPAAFSDDFPCNLITVASYFYDTAGEPDPASIALTGISNFGAWEVPVAAFLTSPVPEFEKGDTYYPVGTSISAPIITGILANWLAENPMGTVAEFRKTYYSSSNNLKNHITNGHYLPHDASPWNV